MSSGIKQWLSGVICLIGALVMVFAIQQMVPHGLAGNFGKVKLYFGLMMAGAIFAVPAGIASIYYRARMDGDNDIKRTQVETTTLAQSAPKPTKAEPKTSESTRSNTPKSTRS